MDQILVRLAALEAMDQRHSIGLDELRAAVRSLERSAKIGAGLVALAAALMQAGQVLSPLVAAATHPGAPIGPVPVVLVQAQADAGAP